MIRTRSTHLLLSVAAFVALNGRISHPLATAQGVLFTGVVLIDSTRTPIADADVLLGDLALSARTNELGVFRFGEIPVGVHSLVVRKIGFVPLDTTLAFPPHRTVEREIFLSRLITLDSMKVVAQRSRIPSFDEHRRRGIGSFLTHADLDKRGARRLGDQLSSLVGVRLAGRPPHAYAVSSHGQKSLGGSGDCYAQVYINRALVYGRPGDPLFDLNIITPAQIEAVEYYASDAQTPPEYSSMNSDCGVVVIWTRR